MSQDIRNTSQRAEDAEDRGSSPATGPTLGDIVAARFGRRDLMKGLLGVGAISATLGPAALASGTAAAQGAASAFAFRELDSTPTDRAEVAEGYNAEVLIRWGDAVLADAPAFAPTAQTAAAQARSSATTTTISAISPCRARRTPRPTACSASITNIPTRS